MAERAGATPGWPRRLRESLDSQYGPGPRIASLATVDADHRPHVRSVVCRRVDDSGVLWITSDARSDKNAHVRGHAGVELAFWLAELREQFRIAGDAALLTAAGSGADAMRSDLWRELSLASRSLFFGPAPGQPRSSADPSFPTTISEDEPPPSAFEVLRIEPSRAEYLSLGSTPHRRVRWRIETGWASEEINP